MTQSVRLPFAVCRSYYGPDPNRRNHSHCFCDRRLSLPFCFPSAASVNSSTRDCHCSRLCQHIDGFFLPRCARPAHGRDRARCPAQPPPHEQSHPALPGQDKHRFLRTRVPPPCRPTVLVWPFVFFLPLSTRKAKFLSPIDILSCYLSLSSLLEQTESMFCPRPISPVLLSLFFYLVISTAHSEYHEPVH